MDVNVNLHAIHEWLVALGSKMLQRCRCCLLHQLHQRTSCIRVCSCHHVQQQEQRTCICCRWCCKCAVAIYRRSIAIADGKQAALQSVSFLG
jgi:hypothetical protein